MRIQMSAMALATVMFASPAQSQDWPQRQVTIVVPFSAGGTTDMFARILSQGLAQKYATPFVVDNRAGAGGNIGAAMVARAALASEASGQRGYPSSARAGYSP